MSNAELATGYAALILADEGIEITADKLQTLTKAAGIEVESIWSSLFAKALEGKDVKDLLLNVGGIILYSTILILGSSGAAPAAAAGAGAGAAAPAEEKEEEKKEEEKEESDEDVLSLVLMNLANFFRWVSACLIRVLSRLTADGGLKCNYSTS
jgi:large subunit ribosomal protein LP1